MIFLFNFIMDQPGIIIIYFTIWFMQRLACSCWLVVHESMGLLLGNTQYLKNGDCYIIAYTNEISIFHGIHLRG